MSQTNNMTVDDAVRYANESIHNVGLILSQLHGTISNMAKDINEKESVVRALKEDISNMVKDINEKESVIRGLKEESAKK